jgi:predicted transcriptional regulator
MAGEEQEHINENSVKIHIEITNDLKEGLDQLKEKEGRTMQWLVRRAIENFLKAKKAAKNEQDTQ